MSLSFRNLISILPPDALWSCSNAGSRLYGIKRVSRDDRVVFTQDSLYVLSYSDYRKAGPKQIPNALIYSRDPITREDLPVGVNAIVLYRKDEIERIIEYVSDNLVMEAKLGSISAMLQSSAVSKAPFQTMLNQAFELLMNPIFVTDMSFTCIGRVGADSIQGNQHWEFAAANGFFSQEYIDMVFHKNREAFEGNIEEELILDDKDALETTHNQYSSRLIFDGKVIGYVKVLEYNHSFSPMDGEILKLLAKYLSPVIAARNSQYIYTSTMEENFLFSILKQDLKSSSDIEMRRSAFGIRLGDTMRMVVLDLPSIVLHSDMLQILINKLRMTFEAGHPVLINNEIAMLLDYRQDEDPLSGSKMAQFLEILDQYGCTACISMEFSGLSRMFRHYTQAKACQEVRRILKRTDPVLFYSDIVEYHMLLTFGKSYDYRALLHPAILTLQEYDRKTNSMLLDSLLIINRHQGNLSLAAKEMYIHYNTLKYRVEKIVNLTHLDLQDPDVSFRISLSAKVLEILRSTELGYLPEEVDPSGRE